MVKTLAIALLVAASQQLPAAVVDSCIPSGPETTSLSPAVAFETRAPMPTGSTASHAFSTPHGHTRLREVLYCQPPSFDYAVNASTAFDSEVADDLPDSLAGSTVGEVTLYVTEWGHSEWVEPLGVVINFYDNLCPPEAEPTITCSLTWSGLATSLEYHNPPTKIVYSATAALPAPVTLTPGMSIGAYVVTDWPAQPYAGLTLTEPDELYGCGEAYWDNETHGAPRWTQLSSATGVAADLAFCLSEEGTGIRNPLETSWGRLKRLFR